MANTSNNNQGYSLLEKIFLANIAVSLFMLVGVMSVYMIFYGLGIVEEINHVIHSYF